MKPSDINIPVFISAIADETDDRMIARKSQRAFSELTVLQISADNVIEHLIFRKGAAPLNQHPSFLFQFPDGGFGKIDRDNPFLIPEEFSGGILCIVSRRRNQQKRSTLRRSRAMRNMIRRPNTGPRFKKRRGKRRQIVGTRQQIAFRLTFPDAAVDDGILSKPSVHAVAVGTTAPADIDIRLNEITLPRSIPERNLLPCFENRQHSLVSHD